MKINELEISDDLYSFPSIAFLAYDEYDHNPDPYTISATSLLKSDRELVCRIRGEKPITSKTIFLQDLSKMRIGTAIHSQIEKVLNDTNYLKVLEKNEIKVPKQIITEQRSSKQLQDTLSKFTITGKFDLLIDGQLHDVKTTSTYTYTSGCNDEKYRLQGSIYRWLNQDIVTSDTIKIVFIFTDWKRGFSETVDGYPLSPIIEKEYKLYDIEYIENIIKEKMNKVNFALENNTPMQNIQCCDEKDVYSNVKYALYRTLDDYTNGKRAAKVFTDYEELVMQKESLLEKNSEAVIIKRYGTPMCCRYCELEHSDNKEETIYLFEI